MRKLSLSIVIGQEPMLFYNLASILVELEWYSFDWTRHIINQGFIRTRKRGIRYLYNVQSTSFCNAKVMLFLVNFFYIYIHLILNVVNYVIS